MTFCKVMLPRTGRFRSSNARPHDPYEVSLERQGITPMGSLGIFFVVILAGVSRAAALQVVGALPRHVGQSAAIALAATAAAPPLPRCSALRCVLPVDNAPQMATLERLLRSAGLPASRAPDAVSELTAGFCNYVYCVVLPGKLVVVKLFSPLAKLRVDPQLRGFADESAGADGLGPRLLYRDEDGLVIEFVPGDTLTEADMHSPEATGVGGLIEKAAERVAALHSAQRPTPAAESPDSPVDLWLFIDRMLEHVEGGSALERQRALPRGFSLSQLKAEATRLRRLYESLELPLVIGHGDLKPSNLMLCDHADPECAVEGVQCGLDDIVFIDFELAGNSHTHFLFMSHPIFPMYHRIFVVNSATRPSLQRIRSLQALPHQRRDHARKPRRFPDAVLASVRKGGRYGQRCCGQRRASVAVAEPGAQRDSGGDRRGAPRGGA